VEQSPMESPVSAIFPVNKLLKMKQGLRGRCPDGLSCEIVVEEFYGVIDDVLVTQPDQAAVNPWRWSPIRKDCAFKHVRSFFSFDVIRRCRRRRRS
jgi:hypothetical protein